MSEKKENKFTPFTGLDKDLNGAKGKKTKVTLFSDRMKYEVCYEYKVLVTIENSLGEETTKSAMRYIEETGAKLKDSITDIIKYIKTDYDEIGEPFKINVVDVGNSSGVVTFEIDTLKERDDLYNDLYEWKFGKDE